MSSETIAELERMIRVFKVLEIIFLVLAVIGIILAIFCLGYMTWAMIREEKTERRRRH